MARELKDEAASKSGRESVLQSLLAINNAIPNKFIDDPAVFLERLKEDSKKLAEETEMQIWFYLCQGLGFIDHQDRDASERILMNFARLNLAIGAAEILKIVSAARGEIAAVA
jgi:diacylglycerol kinase family enzyme